jgi:hypothetical protein
VRGARDRQDAILGALFWGPVVLAAVWIVLWPPLTVDGPAHLLGATAWADHRDPIYREYYRIDTFPTPNLAGTVLLTVLVKLGSLRFATTVMLLLGGLGTPLALRYAIRGIRPASGWLAIAGLPLSFGYLYFYGFWNYCVAIALALVCVGVALRAAPEWRARSAVTLAGLLTLTWLTHLVPFAAAVLFLAAVVVRGPRTGRAWLMPSLAVVPAVVLSVVYLLHTSSGDGPTWTSPAGRALGLVSLHTTITTYSRWEDAVAVAIALVLLELVRRARNTAAVTTVRGAGLAATAATALVLVVPTNFGIDFGLIDERLAVFPVLFGLIWLAARPLDPATAVRAAAALVVATLVLTGLRVSKLDDYRDLRTEYLSAGAMVEPDSVLVALRFADLGPDAGRNGSWDPTRHLASELAADRHSIDVGHYEAVLDYFPAVFREPDLRRAIDPDLAGLEEVPPTVQLPGFGRTVPGGNGSRPGCTAILIPRPDPASDNVTVEGPGRPAPPGAYLQQHRIRYVLLIGPPASAAAKTAYADAQSSLATCGYERLGATSPRGLVEVWRLKAEAAG